MFCPECSEEHRFHGEYVPEGMVDSVRPLVGEGERLIWRDSFRWKDAAGHVLSNHYDGMSIYRLAADFGYEVVRDWNHVAIVRKVRW